MSVTIHHAKQHTENNQKHSGKRPSRLRFVEEDRTGKQRVDQTGVIYDRNTGNALLLKRIRQKHLPELGKYPNEYNVKPVPSGGHSKIKEQTN